jgi:hypothetical protein
MPTLGNTSAPSFGWVAHSGSTFNQYGRGATATEPMLVTDIGVYLRGYSSDCSFRGVVWNDTRNTVLGYTNLHTADGASGSAAASNLEEWAVTTEFEVADGETIYIGFIRAYSGAMQFAYDSGGPGYWQDDRGGSSVGPMAGEEKVNDRDPAFYVRYEDPLPEVYVRRSGVFEQLQQIYVRRSGVFEEVGAEVYVRRSGVWVKA